MIEEANKVWEEEIKLKGTRGDFSLVRRFFNVRPRNSAIIFYNSLHIDLIQKKVC